MLSGREPKPQRWEASEYPLELLHSLAIPTLYIKIISENVLDSWSQRSEHWMLYE
jgi:hypothetical protein